MKERFVERRQLARLATAGRAFARAAGMDDLLPQMLDLVRDVIGADAAAVWKLDADRNLLQLLHVDGTALRPRFAQLPIERVHALDAFPAIGTSSAIAQPWLASLDDGDPSKCAHDLLRDMGMQSLVAIPVLADDTVWGQLMAFRSDAATGFTSDEVLSGEILASMIASALVRIEDRDRFRRLAYVDGLTNLANRRAVDTLLADRFSPLTLRVPIGAIMCDLDGLKVVNDRRGHAAGDQLLRDVGWLLTRIASSRKSALAARLGGDEFCVILEDVTEEELDAVTRQIVDGVAALPHGVTISCGWARVASRPADASPAAAARSLLRMADAAQYRSKHASYQRRSAGTTARETQPVGATGQRIVDRTFAMIEGCVDVEDRVVAAAAAIAEELRVAGWVVAKVDPTAVSQVRAGGHGAGEAGFGPVGAAPDDGRATVGADTPVLVALEPPYVGTYQLAMDRGAESERTAMALAGVSEVIGVTTRTAAGHGWRVELSADAVSSCLEPHVGLLRALIEFAVHGSPERAQHSSLTPARHLA